MQPVAPSNATFTTQQNLDEENAVDAVFIEQARYLCQGGELLPGNINMLAKALQNAAETQTPLRIKLGLDPTRPDLHLGHTVVLRRLRAFQDLGHTALLVIGDATAMIGDPSGKNQTRPPLTEEDVLVNAETYLQQAGKVIDVHKATIVRNSEWFSGMGLSAFLKLASQVTVAQLLARDDFNRRYKENRPIALHELYYPLMQAYDSVMLNSDVELGGTDQRFNNLLGREFQAIWNQQPENAGKPQGMKRAQQLVLLLPLLEGTDGAVKMSKSYPQHCINLTDTPDDFYGKVMSIPDELITRYELLLSPLHEEQIAEHARLMALPKEQGGINPRDLKAGVAKWLVSQYHGQALADAAEEAFINRFRNKQLPETMPEVSLPAVSPHSVLELLVNQGLAASKSEARRLMAGGGVKQGGTQKLTEPEAILQGQPGESVVLQVGKLRFLRIGFV